MSLVPFSLVIFITPTGILKNLGSVHRELLSLPPTISVPVIASRMPGFLFLTLLSDLTSHRHFLPHSFHTWEVNWSFSRNLEFHSSLPMPCPSLCGILLAQLTVQRRHRIASGCRSTFHILEVFPDPWTNTSLLPDCLQGCKLLHKIANFLSTRSIQVFFFFSPN